MRAWPAPHVPALPGRGLPVRLYDTATGIVRPPQPGPVATMYVCGITPYDATHLGHAATYLAFDLLNRVWRDAGHDVRYVQNITDVDDPLLERADETGQDWRELADTETRLFTEDMAWLRVLPPSSYVGAVESIPLIIRLIKRMEPSVYELDGDLYFSVRTDPAFGAVSRLPEADMRALFAERGGDPDRPGKKDPLDPLVWLKARPGEPSWDSPFGPGRPGWHVECAAIAMEYLGVPFDVQGGGSDLVFPHHEMSASHSQVVAGAFASHYAHAGMVGLDGEKMSKSLGNLVFVHRLRADGVEPAAVRLALLSGHYRADREWSASVLTQAQERLARWRTAVAAGVGAPAEPVLAAVRERLADDLDAPGALAAVDRWTTTPGTDPAAPAVVAAATDALLGVSL
ncbi:cysteine--1-D-myo-inosityl 2-amino-2-deoxy-alpha-D-glucopyranoside ligase [Jiangella sp. DSM 45060]|uniref:cysteine--1-D-myo-inosityl 2-amino-2-deoxy-alpha-D-glucopyranoside ligase n=1 Tax=Jiangella sp. DSM 45060 TaxID=1798224 RepID=UPI000879DC64|nr:cysteine--1-D-myo-inosityl 2-amino-2-deoxy-alpha-D-glucopyranoside ligase [Jiangella sp. DSM 45060]SDS98632.1 L-cysteine:1D-myo-inositol 2-amino-2-deoxy-alpha-D-glucopyranoside ligase [Jiangella sp. DSM 45060]